MKDDRDEFIPFWPQTAVSSAPYGGILGQLADPVVEPQNDPWLGTYPETPWHPTRPLYPFLQPPGSWDPSSPALRHVPPAADTGFPAQPAEPVVPPWNDPRRLSLTALLSSALPATFSPPPPPEHLDTGKYWPVAPAPSGANEPPPAHGFYVPPMPQAPSWDQVPTYPVDGAAQSSSQPSPVTAAGLAKQGAVGVGKGLIGLPGMFGDARDLGFNIGDWIAQKILDRRTLTDQQGLEQAHAADFTPGAAARQKQQRYDEARRNLFATNPFLALAPSSSDIQGVVEQVTGPFRKPENMAEEYIDTIGQFAPSIFGGPAGWARRGAQWLVPALTSETAGQLTKGTEWEPAARLAGAIFGGAPAYFARPSAPRAAPPPAPPVAGPPPPRPAVVGEVPVAAPQRVEDARERAFGRVEDARERAFGVPERVTAYAPHEAVAGKGTEHLPGMIDQPYKVRERYTNDARSSWANPVTGGDALYEALGSRVLPSRPATGSFTPGNGPLEINPAHVARPTAEMTPGGAIGNESRKMLELGENLRAYVDFQNMGAAHTLTRNAPWEQRNSVNIPLNRRIDPKEMEDLTNFAAPYGFYVSHRGHSPRGALTDPLDQGVTFINKGEEGPSAKELQTLLGRDLAPGIKKILPDAGRPELVKAESVIADLEKLLVSDNEGKRLATEHIARMLADAPPGTIEALDRSGLLREMAAARRARDAYHGPSEGGVRKDAQRAREIIAERGFRGLIEAVQRKEVLPSVLASLGLAGAYEAGPPGE